MLQSGALIENPAKPSKDVAVAIYGLAFKPTLTISREPALEIALALVASHPGKVLIQEPNIVELPTALSAPNVTLEQRDIFADVHVMLVDHTPFKNLPRPSGLIVDTRGVWS